MGSFATRTRLFAIALTMVVGSVAAGEAGPAGAVGVPVGRPTPVIYDSDMDFDDASTLAYLCEEHKLRRIDLRAVTVANDGFGKPGRALRHAHSVLEQCGLPEVPVADGSTGSGVHPAPPELVATIETVLTGALADGDQPAEPSPVSAPELIKRTVASAPDKVTVLATGPLTNLAAALRSCHTPDEADPNWLAGRILAIYAMGGAINVPGNLYGSALPGFDNSQEFNMWLDPASARDVFRMARQSTVHLVPLDATRHVPITPAFVERLAADQHAPGARLVYKIVSQPDLAALISLGVMYWWDALAALAAFRNDHDAITAFEDKRISVVQDGVQSGRTVATRYGAPVRAAFDADRARFEQTLLDALNGRTTAADAGSGDR